MISKGIRVTILSDRGKGQSSHEKVDGLEILHVDKLMWLPLIRKKRIVKLLEESKPDIIVWCGRPLGSLVLAKLACTKKPLIWIVESGVHNLRHLLRLSWREISSKHHGFFINEILNFAFPRFLLRISANSSAIRSILVPSSYMKSWLLKAGVLPHKLVIIESGLEEYYKDTQFCSKMERKIKRGYQGDFVVTYMGSPCTLRGSDVVIRGIREVLDQRNFTLTCFLLSRGSIGTDLDHLRSEEKYLERLIDKLKLKNNVKIVSGLLSREELVRYLQLSNVITLPFKLLQSEIPLSVIEAMSLGKIIVTTRIRTLKQIVGEDRGILIEASDPHQLAEAILRIVDGDLDLATIEANARKFALSIPSWTDAAQRSISVLRSSVDQE